ncbi:hypothetical protein GQ607_015099 [Colletotrichum asianum]|uniref:Uncharacterized protein n=1 Tax=Colletotrichum asianum TaxID=702518 RepID=A0A8H3ZN59_9PEZI|nr:hypothetical protein GQ607_015099 [Colletotrichum asianum]
MGCRHVLQPMGPSKHVCYYFGDCISQYQLPSVSHGPTYTFNRKSLSCGQRKAAAAILGFGISGFLVLVTSGWSELESLLLVLPSPYLGVLFEAKTSVLAGHCPPETGNLNRSRQETRFYALINAPSVKGRQTNRAMTNTGLIGREAGMVWEFGRGFFLISMLRKLLKTTLNHLREEGRPMYGVFG